MKMNSNNNDKENFRFMMQRLKESVDPRYLLEQLGFEISRETGREIRGACRLHGGDNKTSFRFNKETRTWVCFSHRCHDIFGNDIIGLIKGCFGIEFIDAVNYLKSIAGDITSVDYLSYKRNKEKEEFMRSHKKTKVSSEIVNEQCLRQFKNFRSKYFLSKGFSKKTLDFFEIGGGHTDGYGYIRDVIPIRDVEGNLTGYSLRDIRENVEDDFKYIHTPGFDKNKVIYNLHNAKNHLENKPLIVVEGFKSVWKLHEMGIYNVAAVMGAHITDGQKKLLFSYSSKNGIVVFFDGDTPGIEGAISTVKELKGKIDVYPIFIIEEGKDPADLDEETLHGYLDGYI